MFVSVDVRVKEGLELLRQGLERLRTIPLAEASDDAVATTMVEAREAAAALAGFTARTTEVFEARRVHDTVQLTAGQWLAHRCRIPKGQALAELRFARKLRAMPATAAALEGGEIPVAAAQALVGANGPRVTEPFAEAEPVLVGHARRLCHADLRRVLALWSQLADPDGAERDTGDHEDANRFHISQTIHGRWRLDGDLDPVSGAEVAEAVRRIEQELFDDEWRELRREHSERAGIHMLDRTPAQRRASALTLLARRASAAPPGARLPRPLVSVLVDHPTLAGRVLELFNSTVITPGQLAGLLTEADVERIVFGPGNRVLEVGERTRFFTGALRRAIQIRDRRCSHPWCDVPSDRCEIDHVDPHACGGPTIQSNGDAKCGKHHPRGPAPPRPPPSRD
jgi:hypothetical protein